MNEYLVHPDPKCVQAQAAFLATCDPEQRRFHELLFMYGNVTYRYHQGARDFEPSIADWEEWLDGLKEPMKSKFRREGFEASKGVLSFTRYVNEKNDVGLEEFVKQHMSAEDYTEYRRLVKA